jgi:hypothetical protein
MEDNSGFGQGPQGQPLFISLSSSQFSQIFKDATLFFSREDISTIASVIPTMDAIDQHLTRGAASAIVPSITELAATTVRPLATLPADQLHPSVKMALLLAKKKMDQYYSNTDESNVYRIAMSTF